MARRRRNKDTDRGWIWIVVGVTVLPIVLVGVAGVAMWSLARRQQSGVQDPMMLA